MGNQDIELRLEILGDALHWLWCCRLQIDRIAESLRNELSLGTPATAELRKAFSRTSLDEHMLWVAGGQLVKAIAVAKQHFAGLSLSLHTEEALRHLRNIYEHWEDQRRAFQGLEPKRRSGKQFAQIFPTGRPWSMSFGAGDLVIAGVLSSSSFLKELAKLERDMLEREAKLKMIVHDPNATSK